MKTSPYFRTFRASKPETKLILLFSSLALLGMAAGTSVAGVPPYLGDLGKFPCPDTAWYRTMYADGNLDKIDQDIKEFRTEMIMNLRPIPIPCWSGVARYQAVTAMALRKDTMSTQSVFATLVKVDPSVELFDLGVSTVVQDLLDEVKADMNVSPTPEEMAARRLVPPPSFQVPETERIQGMKHKYNDLRTLYAVATTTAQISNIAKSLKGESDPAFKLFAAEIMILLDLPPSRVSMVIDEIGDKSEIMNEVRIGDWVGRLRNRLFQIAQRNQRGGSKYMNKTFGSQSSEPALDQRKNGPLR